MAEKKSEKKTNKDYIVDFESSQDFAEGFQGSYIETGTVGLDLAITNGKGLPLGDWITFFAGYGCGKTTVICDMLKRVLSRYEKADVPFEAAYLDLENSKQLIKDMGLVPFIQSGRLKYFRGRKTWEVLDSFFEKVLEKKDPKYANIKVIVIDSVTSVISETAVDNNCGKADYGSKAKAATKCLEKYIPLLEENGVTVLAVAQVRDNIDAGFGEADTKAAIANAVKFYSTVIVRMIKKTSTQNSDVNKIMIKTAFGEVPTERKFVVTLKTTKGECKNRHGYFNDVDILVEYGKRVINQFTIKNMLIGLGYITGSNWYQISDVLPIEGGEKKVQRKDLNKIISKNLKALYEFLKENDLYRVNFPDPEEDPDGYN